MNNVSFRDWTAVAIGVIGLVTSYVSSKNRLPKWARKWLSRIGSANIVKAIEYAAKLSELSSEERRKEAVDYLIKLSEKELGFAIPTSIANLLVEFIYQQWKRK
ncbi:MAG: hypothetical protein ABFD64_09845 [Armatimonadota bacterium]